MGLMPCMPNPNDKEPASLIAGDSIDWTINHPDYLATAGWVLSYKLLSPSHNININSAADGDSHVVTLDSTTTAAYNAGFYTWHKLFTNGAQRKTVQVGNITIKPNIADLTAQDGRSHAKKMLDAIEALLEGSATTGDLHVLQVAGVNRSMQQDTGKLIQLRNQYTIELARENQAAGMGTGRGRVFVRF